MNEANRLLAQIEYDGTNYAGWQRLSHHIAVQNQVEAALSFVAGVPIVCHCSGRTDSGVHAVAQTIHFDTPTQRPLQGWLKGANTKLPDDIRVRYMADVAPDFHARFSAQARSYRYIIYNSVVASARYGRFSHHFPYPLDVQLMQQAADCLQGEQDYSCFRASGCQSSTPFRNIISTEVTRHKEWVMVDITANAFLYHMVRNIVGTLIDAGQGRLSQAQMLSLIANRSRDDAGDTAPAAGLHFVNAHYPDEYQVPMHVAPSFL